MRNGDSARQTRRGLGFPLQRRRRERVRISSAALQAKIMTTAYITGLIDDLRHNDKGQASTEYAGILFVIVAIIAALIGLGFTEVGQAIKDKMTEAIGNLG